MDETSAAPLSGHAPLAFAPTPLHEATRLSEAIGVRVLLKRDDQTGLALGGNKARKLAYLVEDALRAGCDTLVTAGGAQSNFARMTAAAAAVAGLGCDLVLGGREPARWSGNLVLDRLLGARVHFVGSANWLDLLQTPEPDMFGTRARSASDAAVLRRKGHLKEQDKFIQFLLEMHQTHTSLEVRG